MDKERVSILHFAGPPIIGGVESTIFHHARLLVEEGIEVDVIAGRGEKFHENVDFYLIPAIDSRFDLNQQIRKELAEGLVSEAFIELRNQIEKTLEPLLVRSEV